MRLLANENIPLATIRRLRELGYDVFAIRERHAGISDQDVLELALNDNASSLPLTATMAD